MGQVGRWPVGGAAIVSLTTEAAALEDDTYLNHVCLGKTIAKERERLVF